MANYVVVARFDDATDKKLTELQSVLQENGYINAISQWPPHITIAAYENVDKDTLLQWTEKFTDKYSTFDVLLSSLGVLPPDGEYTETAVLFASPSPSKGLIDFYYAFHEKLDEYCGNLGWMYSAKCVHPYAIHATIGIFEIKRMQQALEMIFAKPIFGMAKITALEVYTYPMELIRRFKLGLEIKA